MEQRNQWGYPVSVAEAHFGRVWLRAVCLRLALAVLVCIGLGLIPQLDTTRPERVTEQQQADADWQAAYGAMDDVGRMDGVVLEPAE